ncbi:MAG: SAM-dependent methyltransferase [Candidatus Latescibacteria bacterium]|nr:SAM-dependent methyltransferase [Candidatus Latescibacterota bacterium]
MCAARKKIRASGGRITFADFMGLVLYHPAAGYYTRGRPVIGPQGDFFTSPSASPLFGRLLARQFLRFREELGHPPGFAVVELGGHRGQLRQDVLNEMPELNYRMVEVGDALPEGLVGCVFSNEFWDALPVHRVKVAGGGWQEIYVREDGEGFADELGPLSDPRLAAYLDGLPVAWMEGYETTVNLQAQEWMARLGRSLERGFVLSIDYGFERPEYFSPQRPKGTLRCYHRHTLGDDYYARPGEQDLTAHVDFTALIDTGRQAGLEPVLFTDQGRYLVGIGEEVFREIAERTAGQFSRERQAIHQLIHPGLMGSAFKVLIQRKGC